MDENRLHEKLDKLLENDIDIKVELAELRKGYEYHVYRTDLAEDNINLLRLQQDTGFKEIKQQIEPLKSFRDYSMGAFKFLLLVGSLGGLIIGILKLISH